jgi:HlyD family secretion protein
MPKLSKSSRRWVIVAIVVAIAGFFGFRFWRASQSALPKGIASGNGRIEAKLADASAKEPLRVKEVLVEEGDLVRPGQVLVRLDTITLESQLAEARASVAAARERVAVATAAIVKQKAQIELAKIEAERSRKLLEENAGSQREYDVRKMTVETSTAALAEDQARLKSTHEEVAVAEANVATIQSRIDDATLVSPVLGRVLYRLAEPGEVLGPGGKALTLVNLNDVYMEIFLPAEQASRVKIGADARLTVDYEPDRSAIGFVSFVSPEAQFTPKEVETKSEREKLMFRVKIQIPRALVSHYIERIKTGVRGVGYVKVNEAAVWPDWLQNNLVSASEPEPKVPGASPSSTDSTARPDSLASSK